MLNVDTPRIGVEAKWVSPDAGRIALRRRVIQLVEHFDPWLDRLSALLVVVGPAPTSSDLSDVRDHLATAFSSVPTDVMGFSPGDSPTALAKAVTELAASARPNRK